MSRHFRVAIRCCPSEEEKAWKVEGERVQLAAGTGFEPCSFDHVLTEGEGHAELYERAVSPLIASALEGRDVYLMAYGLPRTGKTHAVFGSSGQVRMRREARGIVARIGQQVFDAVSSDRVCRVSATFCHVFEDGRVADLFDSRRRRLDVVEDRSTKTFSIPALTEHPVSSPLDLTRLAEKANLMRNASGCRKAQAKPAASRTPASPPPPPYKPHCSHAVISVVVERLKGEGEDGEKVVRSQITVVELAGHSIGLVQAGQPCPDSGIETLQQILTTLPARGIVAAASLFPQSSLTKLLKPCLGGNSEALLVGTLSLSETAVESTTRCLQILQEATKIKNYSRCSLSPLEDSALGKTLQLIDSLRSDVCARVGVSVPVQSWEVGQDKGESSVTINGHTFSELSASCSNLVQRAAKLEPQLLRSGVSSKKETKVMMVQSGVALPRQPPGKQSMTIPAAVNRAPLTTTAMTLQPAHMAKPVGNSTQAPLTTTAMILQPAHMAKPTSPTALSQTGQQAATDSSSSDLDSDSSDSLSSLEQASQCGTAVSGPRPPPLRGIPHVKPDSTFVPPRPMHKSRPDAWRPSSGHSHQHEHSLASSSQVSSVVSSWSEAATAYNRQGSPASSSQASSVRHISTPSHPHPSHPPLPPSSHLHRPPFPLRGSGVSPFRPAMPAQPPRLVRPVHVQPAGLARPVLSQPVALARPVFPLPAVQPRPPLQKPVFTGQPHRGQSQPPSLHHPLLTSTSQKPDPEPCTLGLRLSVRPSEGTPSSTPQPSTPGSLTPIHGSPALTPSPTPSPIPPSTAQPTLHPFPTSSQLPPHHLPPISTFEVNSDPTSTPPYSPAMISGGNVTSSSSSLTLTDSDHSQEAQDTFDPVIRNRALSMLRAAPQYNGTQTTGAYPLRQAAVIDQDLPPYESCSAGQVRGIEGRQGEGGRPGGLGDMSKCTSREEIHVAAMEGVKSSQIKKLAIQCGVDYRDHGGRTPLMYAVLGNQPRMCDTLLGLGAKVNTQDSAGLSPLLWATFQAKPQCMKILLRHGADVHIRDAEGRSVFHWAVKSPNIQCLKTLQSQATPTIINTADNEGLTPLHWAVLCSQSTHTQLLLTSAAADPCIQDPEGRTALTHAVLNSSSACIKVILEACESTVNHHDEKGRTVLHYACAEGSTDCVRTLLTARSCDLHCRDSRGTTPLHWAAAANQPSVLQLLLRRGANRSLRDNDELTPVEHAEVRGHTECVHLLHNYGLRRPSSALSVASQVSVHVPLSPSLDEHGHVTLTRPQRKFSLSHSSLHRPPADGQAHPDDSADPAHWAESQSIHNHSTQQETERGGAGRGGGRWRRVLCGGCSRHRNAVVPAPIH